MHSLGKEAKYESWGIYQIFPNKFGSPINSTQVQKQFCSKICNLNSLSNFNLIPKGKLFPMFQSSSMQKLGIFGAVQGWFFQFTIRFNLERLKSIDNGLVQNSAPVTHKPAHATFKHRPWAHQSATRSRVLRRCTPPVHRSGSTPASVADPRGLPRPPPIKAMACGKYPPFHRFLPPRWGEHHLRSSPASRRATRPFDDSFGGVAPHTLVLLFPRFCDH
jgi:hypothetical protein